MNYVSNCMYLLIFIEISYGLVIIDELYLSFEVTFSVIISFISAIFNIHPGSKKKNMYWPKTDLYYGGFYIFVFWVHFFWINPLSIWFMYHMFSFWNPCMWSKKTIFFLQTKKAFFFLAMSKKKYLIYIFYKK